MGYKLIFINLFLIYRKKITMKKIFFQNYLINSFKKYNFLYNNLKKYNMKYFVK
jgi:hypothetical protein